MSIREKLLNGKCSYFDMTPQERENERARIREWDKKQMKRNIFRVFLPGAVIYFVLTIIAVIIRISVRG